MFLPNPKTTTIVHRGNPEMVNAALIQINIISNYSAMIGGCRSSLCAFLHKQMVRSWKFKELRKMCSIWESVPEWDNPRSRDRRALPSGNEIMPLKEYCPTAKATLVLYWIFYLRKKQVFQHVLLTPNSLWWLTWRFWIFPTSCIS